MSVAPSLAPTALRRRVANVGVSGIGGTTTFLLGAPIWQTALVAMVCMAVATVIGIVADPRRLGAWLEEVDEALPKITRTLDTWRTERPKWRRPKRPEE